MAEINIDATNALVGRMGTYVVKQALLGNTVNVFNVEKAVISGDPRKTIEKYHARAFNMGRPQKGPFVSRMPDRFVRRMLRGMLPYKQPRGKAAFKRVMCYVSVPAEHQEKKLQKLQNANSEKLPTLKYTTIQKICKALGGERTLIGDSQ